MRFSVAKYGNSSIFDKHFRQINYFQLERTTNSKDYIGWQLNILNYSFVVIFEEECPKCRGRGFVTVGSNREEC